MLNLCLGLVNICFIQYTKQKCDMIAVCFVKNPFMGLFPHL